MKFIVSEVQTTVEGTVAILNHTKDTRNEADSTYYSILASAAISQLPSHGAIMYTNEGGYIMGQAYTHAQPEPEPEPEPSPEPETV